MGVNLAGSGNAHPRPQLRVRKYTWKKKHEHFLTSRVGWGLGNLKFLKKKNKSFNYDSRPRAGWSMRLVLVRATPRAEVDVIGVRWCWIARALFPCVALPSADRCLHLIIVDNSSDRLVCRLSKLLSGIPNRWAHFWLTRVRFGSVNRCKMRSKEINWNTIILQIRNFRALGRVSKWGRGVPCNFSGFKQWVR